MSDYRVADGHDVALGSLTVLSPQPKSNGVEVTNRVPNLDGTVTDQGLYVELVWDMAQDATAYQAILTAFGLASAKTNAVTIYARSETYTYTRYNGLAVRPVPGQGVEWDQYFARNIRILVKNLEVAS